LPLRPTWAAQRRSRPALFEKGWEWHFRSRKGSSVRGARSPCRWTWASTVLAQPTSVPSSSPIARQT